METLEKIDGLDRYLLVSFAFLFVDLPRLVLYALVVTWPFGLILGCVGAFVFGTILNLSFNTNLFWPRAGTRGAVYLARGIAPFLGIFLLLSVNIFIVISLHNRHVEQEEEEGLGA